jgi:hypothetical protein
VAFRLRLSESLQSIYALMRDYGLPRRTTEWTEDKSKFKQLADEWMTLTKSVDDYRSEYYDEHAVTHRKRLAQWIKHLQRKQDAVHHADLGAKSDVDDPYGTKREQDRARNELAAAWMQAEKLHPILAAYRQDKALEAVDLWELAKEGDDAMRSVLLRAMPTVANIKEARRWLGSGKLSPLTLAPVVELTCRAARSATRSCRTSWPTPARAGCSPSSRSRSRSCCCCPPAAPPASSPAA